MVSAQIQKVLYPKSDRYTSVGVVAAGHQDQGMKKDQLIDERCESEPRIDDNQNGKADKDREDLHDPGSPIIGMNAGKDQDETADQE